jgi:UDP-glucose 4-epimerase
MRVKRVVILGSNGFISSHVEKRLKEKKVKVLSLSRRKVDLTSDISIKILKKKINKNDYILFVAAKAPVKNIEMFIYNLKMLKTISRAITPNKIKKFIYISSDAVYADTRNKISEDSKVCPNSLHGQMHLIRENYLQEVFKKKLCIIRPTLVFGPDDPHNGYGPNQFIREVKKNNSIYLFGKGEEKRDHIFIDDLSYFISKLILNQFYGKINLATGNVHSFYCIAKVISTFNKKKIKFIKRKIPMPHLGLRSFNISKLKKMFPKYRMDTLSKIIMHNFNKY